MDKITEIHMEFVEKIIGWVNMCLTGIEDFISPIAEISEEDTDEVINTITKDPVMEKVIKQIIARNMVDIILPVREILIEYSSKGNTVMKDELSPTIH